MRSLRRHAFFAIGPALAAVIAWSAAGSASAAAYAQMAPVTQYLAASPQTEIDLARSAAPVAISSHATVLVLTAHGYQTAQNGTNGFTCLVERGWTAQFDNPDFWNWKLRGPICYNPPASRSVLQYTLERTKLVLSGLTNPQILQRTTAAVAAKQLPPPEPGSMSYMMSKHGYLGDGVGPWHPHLMLYAPKTDGVNDGASWGADLHGSPVILDTSYHVVPEPETIFMVTVSHWSDGSPAQH
ncbi:MAG TPA: hypothetical protein VGX91_00775 [Candidatus Cybelea sp.]|nr:hypothetical protein [Candidatus Cybelea sp.]